MKKLVLSVALVMGFVGASYAQDINGRFKLDFERLDAYLGLLPTQVEEVLSINERFLESQATAMAAEGVEARDEAMRQAVYGNLKLMREVLNEDQYRKYVMLLNVTNNNNRMMEQPLPDVFVAEKD